MSEVRIPDAVFIPMTVRKGFNSIGRAHSLFAIADNILDVKLEDGEKCYGYKIAGRDGSMMWTKSPSDSYLFPKGHALEGHPRYYWKDMEDGMTYGFLVPDARPALVAVTPEVTNA